MPEKNFTDTSLIKKLGLQPNMKVLLMNAPQEYEISLRKNIQLQEVDVKTVPDIIHLFAANYASFDKGMKSIIPFYLQNKQIITWVSWYKKSSPLANDITEDDIRNYCLQHRLVDIKVCAINTDWSALKLVTPKKWRTPSP